MRHSLGQTETSSEAV